MVTGLWATPVLGAAVTAVLLPGAVVGADVVVVELQALTMPMAIATITSALNLRLGLSVMSLLTLGCSLDLTLLADL
jgi:hypothetical protein